MQPVMRICEVAIQPRNHYGDGRFSAGVTGMALRGELGVTSHKCFVFLIDDGGGGGIAEIAGIATRSPKSERQHWWGERA